MFYQGFMELCEPLGIPGGPPMVHQEDIENHCARAIMSLSF